MPSKLTALCSFLITVVVAIFALPTGRISAQAGPNYQLAYVNQGNIYLAGIENDQVAWTKAVTSDGGNRYPSWSPDGRYLMYESGANNSPSLVILDMSTGKELLTIPQACCGGWSPAESEIAYVDLNRQVLVSAPLGNTSQTTLWSSLFQIGQPGGRLAWNGGEVFITLFKENNLSEVWGVRGQEDPEQIRAPGLDGAMLDPSDALSSPAVSPSGELSAVLDTNLLGFAPGAPETFHGYAGSNAGGGRWMLDLGMGQYPSWSPDGKRFAWVQWIGCNEAGIDAPGFCPGGIGVFTVDSYSSILLLPGSDLTQPAWRPAEPPPAPTNTPLPPPTNTPVPVPTDIPLPTPANQPIPTAAPAQPSAPFCGQTDTVYVYSGMSAYPHAVIIPCGGSTPVEVGNLGGFGDGKTYRFSDPVMQQIQPYDTELGQIVEQLKAYSQSEEIASCQVCGMQSPQPQLKDSISLGLVQIEPAQPQAFKPVKLILKMQGEGSQIESQPYTIDVIYTKDFPYETTHFSFDSENQASAAHLNPQKLQNGSFDLEITGLQFPMTYMGSLYVTVKLKNTGQETSSSTSVEIGPADQPWGTCYGPFLKTLNLLSSIPLPMMAQVEATSLYLEHMQRMEECGDNETCRLEAVTDLEQGTFQSMVSLSKEYADKLKLLEPIYNMDPRLRLLGWAQKAVSFGLDPVKCLHSITVWIGQTIHKANQDQQGVIVNGFMTASPVYPLVTTADGRTAGFKTDGSIVQDIPGVYVTEIGEERLVIVPANLSSKLSVYGYAQGTMDLYGFLAQGNGSSINITFQDVPVDLGANMVLDPSENRHPLTISSPTGKTETRLPDLVEEISPTGETRPVAQNPISGLLPGIAIGAVVLGVVVGLMKVAKKH